MLFILTLLMKSVGSFVQKEGKLRAVGRANRSSRDPRDPTTDNQEIS